MVGSTLLILWASSRMRSCSSPPPGAAVVLTELTPSFSRSLSLETDRTEGKPDRQADRQHYEVVGFSVHQKRVK